MIRGVRAYFHCLKCRSAMYYNFDELVCRVCGAVQYAIIEAPAADQPRREYNQPVESVPDLLPYQGDAVKLANQLLKVRYEFSDKKTAFADGMIMKPECPWCARQMQRNSQQQSAARDGDVKVHMFTCMVNHRVYVRESLDGKLATWR